MLNLVLKLNVTKYLFLYKRFTEKDKQLSNYNNVILLN